MSVLLMKLRGVPDDELVELRSLLEEGSIDYYETSDGNWGLSLPALWLRDETQLLAARSLLDHYRERRFQAAHEEYESLKQSGQSRGWIDVIRESPGRFFLYMGFVLALIYLSTIPWFSTGTGNG